MISTILLLTALILAPVIGGGFGELSNGILQILIFAAIVLHIWASRKSSVVWPRVPGMLPLTIFLAAVIISAFFTESIYPTLKQLLFIIACLGGYVLAAALGRDRKTAAALVWGIALSALFICLFGIRDYAISTGGGAKFWLALLSSGEHMRLFGTFINPGFFAGFLVITIPVTLGVYLATRRASFAALAGLAFIVQISAVLLTGTKFGIASLAAALFVFFILAIFTKSLSRVRLRRLLLIAVVSIPLLLVFSSPFTSRVREAGAGGTQVHSTEFRKYAWLSTINMIKDQPLTGVGPGVYDTAYARYAIAGPTKYAHQSYLQLAAESGVVALVAFISAFIAIACTALSRLFRYSSQAEKDDIWEEMVPTDAWRLISCAIFAALAGSVIRNLADSDWYIIGIALPFWILAGVLVSRLATTDNAHSTGKIARLGQAALCVIMILLSASFGKGDYFASNADDYRLATLVSPMNPKYHREYGKYLAFTANDATEAIKEIKKAIRLAPSDASNYHTLGMVYFQYDHPKSAIIQFNKSLKLNPNSTQTLYQLSQVYYTLDNMKALESTLKRLIEIEKSPYERIKGVPELVDVTYAYAHAYFGNQYLDRKDYKDAVREFESAIDRLERWRSNKQILEMARVTGMLSEGEETSLLDLLRESYFNLQDAYNGLGDKAKAIEARRKGERIK